MNDHYEPFDMTRLMRAVDLAPSILNTRPWKFEKVAADRIELRPDWDRHLRIIDPLHRELLISCGAALFNLRLAIRVTGHDPVVWLFPDEQATGRECPDHGRNCAVGDPLASVEIVTRRTHPVTVTEQRLYEEIPHRHTVREPFGHRMSMNVQAELEQAARKEGARARLLHRRETRRLLREAAQVDQELKLNPAYLDELRQWTGSNATPERGVPAVRLAARRPGPAAASADSDVLPPADLLPDPGTRRGRPDDALVPGGQGGVAVARVGTDGHPDRREIGVRAGRDCSSNAHLGCIAGR